MGTGFNVFSVGSTGCVGTVVVELLVSAVVVGAVVVAGQQSAALLTHSVDDAARFFCCGLNSGDAGANSGFLIVLPGGSVWNVLNVSNVSSMVRNVVPRVTGCGVSTAVNFVVGLGATVLNVATGPRVTAVSRVPTVLILHCADSLFQ